MADRLTREERAALEARAWELRQKSWTLERIAAEVGVHHGTILRMLRRVETRLLKDAAKDVLRVKARQTAILERIAGEALAEWERSKLAAEETTTTERVAQAAGGGDGKKTAQRTKVTKQSGRIGEASLLEQARGALADIRDLWGLDAPKKIDAVVAPVKLYDTANTPEDL